MKETKKKLRIKNMHTYIETRKLIARDRFGGQFDICMIDAGTEPVQLLCFYRRTGCIETG